MAFPGRSGAQPIRATPRPQQPAFAKPYPVGTKSNQIDWTQHGNFGAPPYLPEAGDTPVQRQRMANGAPYNGVEILAMEARDPAKAREMTREMGAWRQTQPTQAGGSFGDPGGASSVSMDPNYADDHMRPSDQMTRNGQRYQPLNAQSQAYMDSLPDSVKNTNMYRMAKQFGKALSPDFIATKFGDQEHQYQRDLEQANWKTDPNSYRAQRGNEKWNQFRSDLGMPNVNGPVTGGKRPEPGPPPGYPGGSESDMQMAYPGGSKTFNEGGGGRETVGQGMRQFMGGGQPGMAYPGGSATFNEGGGGPAFQAPGGGFKQNLGNAMQQFQGGGQWGVGGGGGNGYSLGGGGSNILQQLMSRMGGGGGMQQNRGLQMSPEVAMQRQQALAAIQGAQGQRGPAYNPATAQMSKVGEVANYDATSGQYVRPNGPPQRQSFLGGQLPQQPMAQPQYQPQFGGGGYGGGMGRGMDPRMMQAMRYIGMGDVQPY